MTGSPTGFNRLTITGPRRFKRSTPFFVVAGQLAPDMPMGVLSRGVSGIAHRTLIVNFPGSPKAIAELFPVIAPTLRHVVDTLHGNSRH